MTFTLTSRTIAAFVLGGISTFGLFWLIVLWQWALGHMSEGGVISVYPTGAFIVLWVWLFTLAFGGAGK